DAAVKSAPLSSPAFNAIAASQAKWFLPGLDAAVKSAPLSSPAFNAIAASQAKWFLPGLDAAVKSAPLSSPAWKFVDRARRTQLQTVLGSLDTRTMFRSALTSRQSVQATAISVAVENLEHAVKRADEQTGSEVRLLAIWAESLRELGGWLRQPAVTWSSVALVWFVVSYSWVTLKTERPDVAEMIEVPFTLLAGLLLTAAVTKK
ncbi:hypothetical protein, partial [Micromonospora zingiberis]|uniref:hypothetical protein n=1 Tax=Micromonospora zingiberis TaxID=2053011 RepID=UPI0013F42314